MTDNRRLKFAVIDGGKQLLFEALEESMLADADQYEPSYRMQYQKAHGRSPTVEQLGDFILEAQAITFEREIKTYRELKDLLGREPTVAEWHAHIATTEPNAPK